MFYWEFSPSVFRLHLSKHDFNLSLFLDNLYSPCIVFVSAFYLSYYLAIPALQPRHDKQSEQLAFADWFKSMQPPHFLTFSKYSKVKMILHGAIFFFVSEWRKLNSSRQVLTMKRQKAGPFLGKTLPWRIKKWSDTLIPDLWLPALVLYKQTFRLCWWGFVFIHNCSCSVFPELWGNCFHHSSFFLHDKTSPHMSFHYLFTGLSI